jgi:site-specific DNA-methyltransferase (adenine-specific)
MGIPNQTRFSTGERPKVLDCVDSDRSPTFQTDWGVLYQADCLDILPLVLSESIDLVFADPPFNLGKNYGHRSDDSRDESDYIEWSFAWIDECIRTLKPGGSFFLYNLPKWNIVLGNHMLECGLVFRHWIAVNIKMGLPIPGRLYPSHYSLLYFSKGKPKTFHNLRTPIETCRHCGGEIKDYGGHRDAMNPKGVNLTDVWSDIPPVRHWKFKSRNRKNNQVSTRLVWRAVQIATNSGGVVLDPFGGSGTTYDVCERNQRYWLGVEIEDCDVIIERLEALDVEPHRITDYVE